MSLFQGISNLELAGAILRGIKSGVFINVDTTNMDKKEFDNFFNDESCLSKPLRAPYKSFTLCMYDTPVDLGCGVKLLAVDVINGTIVRKDMHPHIYVTSYVVQKEGEAPETIYGGLAPDMRDSVLNLKFQGSGADIVYQWASAYASIFVDYFCDKMSKSSRWWGDEAKARKKATETKTKRGGYAGGTLNVFVPRSKPNPLNIGNRGMTLKELTREVIVRGGWPHLYWVLAENQEALEQKHKDAGREAVFFPNEKNSKGHIAMVLIMKEFRKGPKGGSRKDLHVK